MKDTLIQQNKDFFQSIIDKRVEDICNKYIQSPDTYVFVEGPRYATLGYPAIAKGWQDFCASGLSLKSIEWVEGAFAEVDVNMGYISGQIVLTVEVKDRAFSVQFRATFVMLKDSDGAWKIKHEHVSAPMPDPYGIGDWLRTTTT
jgi:ketosteroid isomerase-like protein